MEPLVRLRRQPLAHHLLERLVVHVADEDLLVLVHALDEEPFEKISEHQLEFVLRVHGGCLAQSIVAYGRLDDLVEEELVGLIEVGPKASVDNV